VLLTVSPQRVMMMIRNIHGGRMESAIQSEVKQPHNTSLLPVVRTDLRSSQRVPILTVPDGLLSSYSAGLNWHSLRSPVLWASPSPPSVSDYVLELVAAAVQTSIDDPHVRS